MMANPPDEIANVRRLQLVLKEGRVISDKRRAGACHITREV
jgi:hypothetical protein